MIVFRSKQPARSTGVPEEKSHLNYRAQLAKDFNNRCGYTDCSHMWWFGGFEIDHFAPMSPRIKDADKLAEFKKLECKYDNLVYACPQINRSKSNDWPTDDPTLPVSADGSRGYLDPCNNDYNEFFYRTNSGGIMPTDNPIALYMWKRLKLYLKRYELSWRLTWLYENVEELDGLIKSGKLSSEESEEVEQMANELRKKFFEYFRYIDANQVELSKA